jgi:chaperone modulatory protein CbpM
MCNSNTPITLYPVIAEEIQLSLSELCQACHVSEEHIIAWVDEGALEAIGSAPPEWRFTGPALRRGKLALWLTRDLEINLPGVALALDLLDEIANLQAQLQRFGLR